MDLSENQQVVMKLLSQEDFITARRIAERLGYPWTYDQVHAILFRLEKRRIVIRVPGRPSRWRISMGALPHYRSEFLDG